jgi:hypothetical protein
LFYSEDPSTLIFFLSFFQRYINVKSKSWDCVLFVPWKFDRSQTELLMAVRGLGSRARGKKRSKFRGKWPPTQVNPPWGQLAPDSHEQISTCESPRGGDREGIMGYRETQGVFLVLSALVWLIAWKLPRAHRFPTACHVSKLTRTGNFHKRKKLMILFVRVTRENVRWWDCWATYNEVPLFSPAFFFSESFLLQLLY